MKIHTKIGVLLAFLTLQIGCSQSATPIPPSEQLDTATIAKAEAIYQKNCAACHGKDLSGGAGRELKTVGARLPKDLLTRFSKDGVGIMQATPITDEEAKTLGAWLSTKR